MADVPALQAGLMGGITDRRLSSATGVRAFKISCPYDVTVVFLKCVDADLASSLSATLPNLQRLSPTNFPN